MLATIDQYIAPRGAEWRSVVIQIPRDDTSWKRRRLIAQILRAELKLAAPRVRHLHRLRAGHRVYLHVYQGAGTRADHRRFRAWAQLAEELAALSNEALAQRLARATPKRGLP